MVLLQCLGAQLFMKAIVIWTSYIVGLLTNNKTQSNHWHQLYLVASINFVSSSRDHVDTKKRKIMHNASLLIESLKMTHIQLCFILCCGNITHLELFWINIHAVWIISVLIRFQLDHIQMLIWNENHSKNMNTITASSDDIQCAKLIITCLLCRLGWMLIHFKSHD